LFKSTYTLERRGCALVIQGSIAQSFDSRFAEFGSCIAVVSRPLSTRTGDEHLAALLNAASADAKAELTLSIADGMVDIFHLGHETSRKKAIDAILRHAGSRLVDDYELAAVASKDQPEFVADWRDKNTGLAFGKSLHRHVFEQSDLEIDHLKRRIHHDRLDEAEWAIALISASDTAGARTLHRLGLGDIGWQPVRRFNQVPYWRGIVAKHALLPAIQCICRHEASWLADVQCAPVVVVDYGTTSVFAA
jgi:hypothetical protein